MRNILLVVIFLQVCLFANAQQRNNKNTAKTTQTAEQPHLKLYPIVADKYVNIYVTYDEPTDVIITIVGSELNDERKWDVKAVMTHQQSMDVTQLPVGNYTITLQGGGKQEKATFSVKR